MKKYIFRKAENKDIDGIAKIVTELLGTCNLDENSSIIDNNINEISNTIEQYYVCEFSGEIIGACGLSNIEEKDNFELGLENVKEILYLVVSKKHQGMGIETMLLKLCTDNQKCDIVYEAWGDNGKYVNSKYVLEACGFELKKNLGNDYYKNNNYCPFCVNRSKNCTSCMAEVWVKKYRKNMKKLITLPTNYAKSLIDKIDGVIIGIKDLSIGFSNYEAINNIEEIVDKLKNKDIFISLNKNMYNSDLDYLREVIIKISNYDIKGIIYYDLGVYNLVKELDLNIPLYWNQEHLTTNYMTCNFWSKRGVEGTFLSSDITVDEIEEIKKKTNMTLIVQVYGYVKMMASSRKLISNYLEYIKEDKTCKTYEIYENVSDKKYSVIEDNNGTITLTDKCINGIKHINTLSKIKIDYMFFDSLNIDNIEDVIDAFDNNDISYFDDIEDYFLTKKTIYKVKR